MDRQTDGQTELRWLRCTKAVAAFTCKNGQMLTSDVSSSCRLLIAWPAAAERTHESWRIFVAAACETQLLVFHRALHIVCLVTFLACLVSFMLFFSCNCYQHLSIVY